MRQSDAYVYLGEMTFRRKPFIKYASGLLFPSADFTSDVFLSFPKNNREYIKRRNATAECKAGILQTANESRETNEVCEIT